MEETLRLLIARIAEVPPDFPIDAHLRDDLDIDSFRAAELVFEIERVLSTKLPDALFAEAQSFSDILKLVTSVAA
ncbi:MAG TPA: acyl carrier protein [Polyangiales bacterium]